MEKTIYPGKIMYSGFNGTVKPLQFVRHDESETNIYYARFYHGDEFGGEFKCIGLDYLFHTREEAINFALSELSKSIAKLPSVDELRDLEANNIVNQSNSPNLKQFAQRALEVSKAEAKWIAIDSTGNVWAYRKKPFFSSGDYWETMYPNEICWKVWRVDPPSDFTKEIYEISEILSE